MFGLISSFSATGKPKKIHKTIGQPVNDVLLFWVRRQNEAANEAKQIKCYINHKKRERKEEEIMKMEM